MAKQSTTKTTTTTTTKTADTIERRPDGWLIPFDHVWGWTDGKTGKDYHVKAGDITTPDGVEYITLYGLRQSTQDCHSAVSPGKKVNGKKLSEADVKAEAAKAIDKRLAAIKAGDVKATGGGRRADVITNEALAICRTQAGVGVTKFTDRFGKGGDAVMRYALHVVKAKYANKGIAFKATDTKAAEAVTQVRDAIIAKATANVAARGESFDEVIDAIDV